MLIYFSVHLCATQISDRFIMHIIRTQNNSTRFIFQFSELGYLQMKWKRINIYLCAMTRRWCINNKLSDYRRLAIDEQLSSCIIDGTLAIKLQHLMTIKLHIP
jgi:hypothetical protein